MTPNNLPATISPLHEQIGVPEKALALLTPVQQGWIRLSKIKTETFDFLTKNELKVQELCLKLQRSTDLTEIQQLLKEAKQVVAEGKDCRMTFTKMLDEKLIAPSMLFEKRNIELLKAGDEKELEVRKAAYAKAKAEEDLNKEMAGLKAHIQNEWLRIGAKYRNDIDKIITDGYTYALNGNFKGELLFNHMKALQKFIVDTKLDAFRKFERRLVDDAKAQAIFKEVTKYEPGNDLQAGLKSLESKFASYDADLQNKEKAIAQAQREADEKKAKEQEQLEIETSTNNLVSQASEYTVTGEGAAPSLKYKDEIVEENTPEWAMAVLTAFITNFKDVSPLLKVKTWSKLSISQMGTALEKIHNETGKSFNNLKFSKTIK